MQIIGNLTHNISEIVDAIRGKWSYQVKDGKTWTILGNIVFVEDSDSKNNFPYPVISWHESDGGYWGIMK